MMTGCMGGRGGIYKTDYKWGQQVCARQGTLFAPYTFTPKHPAAPAHHTVSRCRRESVAINSSLMTLGRCLEALRWNQQHKGSANLRVVPYRESKVTHLFRQAAPHASRGWHASARAAAKQHHHQLEHLQPRRLTSCPIADVCRDALHGWGQVVLSVNVSPVTKDYDETAHVLKASTPACLPAMSSRGWQPAVANPAAACCLAHPCLPVASLTPTPVPASAVQYAALATQIGTMQQAEAPRRTLRAVSPAIKKVKRKAALPVEARRQGPK